MSERTYYQRSREVMLDRAEDYYENKRSIKRESKK